MANRPPLLNQLSLPDSARSFDCGETADAMLLQAGGIPDTPEEEISDLNHDGVTNGEELVGLLRANKADVVQVPTNQFADLLAGGDAYALLLIHDDNYGDPDPRGPNIHWIVGYAIASSGAVQCVNPLGGRDVPYNRVTLELATIEAHIVRWPAQQAGNQHPTGGTPEQEIEMTPEQAAQLQEIHNVLFGAGPGGGPARDEMYTEHTAILKVLQTLAPQVQEIHNTLFSGEDGSLLARIDANVQALTHK